MQPAGKGTQQTPPHRPRARSSGLSSQEPAAPEQSCKEQQWPYSGVPGPEVFQNASASFLASSFHREVKQEPPGPGSKAQPHRSQSCHLLPLASSGFSHPSRSDASSPNRSAEPQQLCETPTGSKEAAEGFSLPVSASCLVPIPGRVSRLSSQL